MAPNDLSTPCFITKRANLALATQHLARLLLIPFQAQRNLGCTLCGIHNPAARAEQTTTQELTDETQISS